MKFLLNLFFIFLFFFFNQSKATQIEVLKVYDGDTVLARIEDNIFRIRLVDIDCFEGTFGDRANYQAKKYKLTTEEIVEGGNIAGDILKEELNNKNISFKFYGIDKYHRALGIIYANNENINQKMLTTPYCHPYKK